MKYRLITGLMCSVLDQIWAGEYSFVCIYI